MRAIFKIKSHKIQSGIQSAQIQLFYRTFLCFHFLPVVSVTVYRLNISCIGYVQDIFERIRVNWCFFHRTGLLLKYSTARFNGKIIYIKIIIKPSVCWAVLHKKQIPFSTHIICQIECVFIRGIRRRIIGIPVCSILHVFPLSEEIRKCTTYITIHCRRSCTGILG